MVQFTEVAKFIVSVTGFTRGSQFLLMRKLNEKHLLRYYKTEKRFFCEY